MKSVPTCVFYIPVVIDVCLLHDRLHFSCGLLLISVDRCVPFDQLVTGQLPVRVLVESRKGLLQLVLLLLAEELGDDVHQRGLLELLLGLEVKQRRCVEVLEVGEECVGGFGLEDVELALLNPLVLVGIFGRDALVRRVGEHFRDEVLREGRDVLPQGAYGS